MSVVVNDKALKKVFKNLKKLAKESAKVGILGSRGGNEDRDGITMVELAVIHELGSPDLNIPQRSFIRETFEDSKMKEELKNLLARTVKSVIVGKLSPDEVYEVLGQWGVSKIKNRITFGDGISPANALYTIERKGSSTPLVDTGRLLNAITHEVSKDAK